MLSEQGNDTLTGGAGADEFHFAAPAGAADADVLTDFTSGSDKIVLYGYSYHEAASGNSETSGSMRANASLRRIDRVIYDSSSGRLYYDPDGAGAASPLLMATLQGAPTLSATDIDVW